MAISCLAAAAFEQLIVSIFQLWLLARGKSILICVELAAHIYSHLFVKHGPLS